MQSRRITADNPQGLLVKTETGPLKQVAGLIQKLSYRDMQRLASALNQRWVDHEDDGDKTMADCLLCAADDILTDQVSA